MRRWIFPVLVLASMTVGPHGHAAPPNADAQEAAALGSVVGTVTDQTTKKPIPRALVIVQCTCLAGDLETYTDAKGIYRFGKLPPGNYIINVFFGNEHAVKVTRLPAGAKLRANFALADEKQRRQIIVKPKPVETISASPPR